MFNQEPNGKLSVILKIYNGIMVFNTSVICSNKEFVN